MKTKRHAFSHEKKEPNGGARPMRWQQHRTQKNAARVNKLSRNEASTGLSLEWDPTRSTWEKERGKKQQQQQPTQTKPNRRRKNRFNELLTISIYVWSSRSLYLFLSASLLDCPSTRMSCAEKKQHRKLIPFFLQCALLSLAKIVDVWQNTTRDWYQKFRINILSFRVYTTYVHNCIDSILSY